ncbi:MAG: universal stress protein [Halobacteriaceae archaeon]
MHHYQDILVATDGSDPAARAVDHACALADGIDDTVYVLSVADTEARPMAFGAESTAAVEAAMERTVEEMREHTGDVRGAIREGEPAEEILAFAGETDADVVVLGRSGRSGLPADVIGSTANRVVQRTTLPVVLIPPTAEASGGE